MDTLSIVQKMLIEEFDLTAEKVQPDANLADLGIDSLATIEFMFSLEDHFKLNITDDESTPKVATVSDIVAEIDKRLDQQAASETN